MEWLERICKEASRDVLASAIATVAPDAVIERATPEEIEAAQVVVERGRVEIERMHD